MRTKKLFGMKKVMRTMALGLAAMLVAGSLNVMEAKADDVFSPYYNQDSGKYVFNTADVFGAATHVHLFGEKVTTTAHTHGNVMAIEADLQEIGMRDEKLTYPKEYTEYSYADQWVALSSVTVHDPLIIGPNMKYSLDSGKPQGIITNANNSTANALTVYDGVFYKTGETAVDIPGTLTALETKSIDWAANPTSANVTVEFALTDQKYQNNRYIDAAQGGRENEDVFVNITYEDWTKYSTFITLKGLDSTVTNTGKVIINIDMTNAPKDGSADLSGNDMKAFDTANNAYHNTEHTTAAFGGCRVVYNLYQKDTNGNIQAYNGTVTFDNIVFGSILAPRAKVTVGAINGNVMAKEINHTGQESHRLDISPVFSYLNSPVVPDKVGKTDISLLLQLKDTPDATDFNNDPNVDDDKEPIESNTTYTLYKADGTTPAYVANTTDDEKKAYAAFNDINATWNADEEKYEVIIGSEFVTNYISTGEYWLKKTDITDGYKDNDVTFKVTVTPDGTMIYTEVKSGVAGTPQRAVLTDILEKGTTAPTIDDIVLNLDLKGDDESKYAADELSGVKYQLYEDVKLQTEVTGKEGSADWVGDHFEVTIPGTGLTPGETYYLAKEEIAGNADGYKDNKTIYEVNVGTDGKITYRVTDNGTFSGTPEAGPLTDLLIRPNGPAGLDVIFNGPAGTKPGAYDKVSYEIYADPECTKPVAGSKTEVKPSTSNNTGWNVEFGTDLTDKLEQDKSYYIAISGNGSSYKDEQKTVYEVQFDSSTGNAEYNNGGTWTTTIPTDKLIKNEEVQLNVKLEGDTSGNTNSDVTYDIYDATTGDKVTDTPIQATDNDKNGTYEVIVDSTVTTEKLDRDKIYYIEVSGNNSGYTDKSKDKYYVTFDKDGNAQYSTDKQIWQDAPLTDLLVKDTVKPDEDSSDKPAEDTNKPSTGGSDDTNKAPSAGGNDSNSGGAGNGGSGNAATDGAGANNATDGANANNSAVTGSNSMDSAKTGEVQTVYIFAGFAAVIAIAAGVYVFIKRKRA